MHHGQRAESIASTDRRLDIQHIVDRRRDLTLQVEHRDHRILGDHRSHRTVEVVTHRYQRRCRLSCGHLRHSVVTEAPVQQCACFIETLVLILRAQDDRDQADLFAGGRGDHAVPGLVGPSRLHSIGASIGTEQFVGVVIALQTVLPQDGDRGLRDHLREPGVRHSRGRKRDQVFG